MERGTKEEGIVETETKEQEKTASGVQAAPDQLVMPYRTVRDIVLDGLYQPYQPTNPSAYAPPTTKSNIRELVISKLRLPC